MRVINRTIFLWLTLFPFHLVISIPHVVRQENSYPSFDGEIPRFAPFLKKTKPFMQHFSSGKIGKGICCLIKEKAAAHHMPGSSIRDGQREVHNSISIDTTANGEDASSVHEYVHKKVKPLNSNRDYPSSLNDATLNTDSKEIILVRSRRLLSMPFFENPKHGEDLKIEVFFHWKLIFVLVLFLSIVVGYFCSLALKID